MNQQHDLLMALLEMVLKGDLESVVSASKQAETKPQDKTQTQPTAAQAKPEAPSSGVVIPKVSRTDGWVDMAAPGKYNPPGGRQAAPEYDRVHYARQRYTDRMPGYYPYRGAYSSMLGSAFRQPSMGYRDSDWRKPYCSRPRNDGEPWPWER